MGWGDSIKKMKEKVKKQMRDRVAKIKAEQIAKGLTVEEYVDAKNNGTLNSLPIVNNNNTNNTPLHTNNTPLYIGIGAVGLVVVYLLIKRKK